MRYGDIDNCIKMSIVGATFQGQQQLAGRSYYATKSTANSGNLVIDPLRLTPKDQWQYNNYIPSEEATEESHAEKAIEVNHHDSNDYAEEVEASNGQSLSDKSPLLVKYVDLNICENCKNHHTDFYEIAKNLPSSKVSEENESNKKLVVRRGDSFKISVLFNKKYDSEKYNVQLQLQLGNESLASKNTCVTLCAKDGVKQRRWSAGISSIDECKAVFEIRMPGDCSIGKWKLHIDTTETPIPTDESNEDQVPPIKHIQRYTHPHPIYIIFNPWSQEDAVFMENSEHLADYIFAETGRIFMGNYRHTISRPWVYGQFEDFVLDCSLQLLDVAKLKMTVRNNPVLVAKALCSIISSPGGVLTLSWTGNYDDGISPCSWTGSIPILAQYIKQQESVKFGQCWTIAGVLTTVCRALGIPCRPVTNYLSFHDCDGSTTADVHWNILGEPFEEWNRDAIWSFHVWNEVWMARSDLPHGYGGWQAVDATPRETSQGLQVAGPVSVKAIKEGDVFLPHNTSSFFASVNSDMRHWVYRDDLSWIQKTKKHSTGVLLLTKKPFIKERSNMALPLRDKWEDSLTQSYKYNSNTEQERKAIQKANLPCAVQKIAGPTEDVGFEFIFKDGLMVGHNFDVTIQIQNKSRLKRTVRLTLTCSSVYYTGVFRAKLKSDEKVVELSCIKATQANLRLNMDDYLHLLTDQLCFRFSCQAEVLETGQIYASWDDFRLDKPKIEIVVPETAVVGKPFPCHIQMQNPTTVFLTKATWFIEGPGLQMPMEIPFGRDVDPYETVTHKLMLTPTKCGRREVVVTFDSKELRDISGVQEILVSNA